MDLFNNTVTLYSGETKSDEGGMVVLTEECRLLLAELRRGKKPEDFLFTRKNGEVVKGFRGTWEDLTETAGVPGLLERPQHDPPGVPQKTPRTVSGHKTDAVFSRSNIVSEDDIRDAARRIEEGPQGRSLGLNA